MSESLFELQPSQNPVRAKVGEWLAGMEAVRDGTFDVFFIEVAPDGSGIPITPENVDGVETRVREVFGKRYPELALVSKDEE